MTGCFFQNVEGTWWFNISLPGLFLSLQLALYPLYLFLGTILKWDHRSEMINWWSLVRSSLQICFVWPTEYWLSQHWKHLTVSILLLSFQAWNSVPIFYFWCLVLIVGGSWPLFVEYEAWKWWHSWYVAVGALGLRFDVSCRSAGRVSSLTPVSRTIDADVAPAMPNTRLFWLWKWGGPSAVTFVFGLHCWSLVSGTFW